MANLSASPRFTQGLRIYHSTFNKFLSLKKKKSPSNSTKIHIGDLRGRYEFHGLDITEMRAIWHWLPPWTGDNPKSEWRRGFKNKLDMLALAEINGTIQPDEVRNPAYDVTKKKKKA